jgi:hypothetical protein
MCFCDPADRPVRSDAADRVKRRRTRKRESRPARQSAIDQICEAHDEELPELGTDARALLTDLQQVQPSRSEATLALRDLAGNP